MNPSPSSPCPRFSVVIPTYNRAGVVGAAIRSALAQDLHGDSEIIVVDDGSTDGTTAVLEGFGSAIRLVRQSNRGVSAARNAGASTARGTWLAFLDSDDTWRSGFLRHHAQLLDRNSGVVFQCTDAAIVEEGTEKTTYFALSGATSQLGEDAVVMDRPFRFVLTHSPWQVGSMVVDAQAFKKAGGFDTSLNISEDLDLIARLALQGAAVFHRVPLTNVNRHRKLTDSLSVAASRDLVRKRQTHEAIFDRMQRTLTLNAFEQQTLKRVRAANLRALGNELLASNRLPEARRSFWCSFQAHRSLTALGKLCIAYARRT